MLETYKRLVDFLGLVMGEQCKIILFDLTLSPPAVAAIANGSMEGGKGIGAPLTHVAREILESGEWKNHDYKVDFPGRTRSGELLRSSYFFIKEEDQLVGMLSINFSSDRYRKLCAEILQLGGFSGLLSIHEQEKLPVPKHFSESFPDVSDLVAAILGEQFCGMNSARLTQEEKMTVIRALHAKGVFLIKGAVPEAARALSCSEATIYRYLSRLSHES